MNKIKLATVWLDGCSGCHMSFLDMDERLLELSDRFDLVFSPIVDFKEYPKDVDIALVEGAVSSPEDEEKIHRIRRQTKTLIAMGDCSVTGNVSSLRNPFGTKAITDRAYFETATLQQQVPCVVVPKLYEKARPVHEFVTVDVFLPGCPPSADTFYSVLSDMLAGRPLEIASLTRFGA